MKSFVTHSDQETIALAKRMTGKLPKEVHVIILEGDLSAGKTTFTKGIAQALNISRIVNSPTFTIFKVYEGTRKLYHLDLYRLEDSDHDFDLLEYVTDDEALTVIEWPTKVPQLIPDEHIKVTLKWMDEDIRQIEISSVGIDDAWEYLL